MDEKNIYIYILLIVFIVISNILSPQITCAATLFPAVLPGEGQQISIIGSTLQIKGLTDQTNKVLINNREIALQKDGSFQEDVLVPLGENEIIVAVVDKEGKTKEYSKKIKAKENYFFLVGIADGTLNWANTSGHFDWLRDSTYYKDGFHKDAKLSYYMVGKLKGKYLIKSALDTDKATQEKLFSNIDPNKYYPIYGDNSTVVYDVNSQGKFYLLVEHDRSGFTLGNYQTEFADTQLVKYNRTLYGGKLHLETPQRTVYGEPVSSLSMFLAEANQYQGHSEFLATGGSLYYLRHRNLVEGSEQVRLDIRDKNTGMTLSSVPQRQNIDYQIKYDEGRILFQYPVLSVAASDTIISTSILEGNPVYIVVNYEYKNQEAFPITIEDLDKKSGGIRLSQAIGDNLRLGASYIKEQKLEDNYHLLGSDASIQIGNFTKISAEIAKSEMAGLSNIYASYTGGLNFIQFQPSTTARDSAQRLTLTSSLGEYLGKGREFLEISSYYQKIGRDFTVPDVASEAGTEKYGVELGHRFTPNDTIRLISETNKIARDQSNQLAENQLTVKEARTYTGQWQHTQGKALFTTEYRHKRQYDLLAFYNRPLNERIVAERLDYKLNPDTSFFVGQQVAISGEDGKNNQTSLGLNTKVSKDTTLSTQTAFNRTDSSLLLGLNKNIDENNTTYMNYNVTNSKTDGKSSTTSFGANTRLGQNAALRRERQLVTSDVRGAYLSTLTGLDCQLTPRFNLGFSWQRREETLDPHLIEAQPKDTASLNTAYARPDKLKVNNKFEFREDTGETISVLFNNSAELKVTPDIFLFGQYDYTNTRKEGSDSYAKIEVKQIGLAFRPLRYDWFNCLFKYTNLVDDRPQGLSSADGGFIKANSSSDVYATEFAFDLSRRFQLVHKFSYKNEETMSYDALRIVQTPDELEAWLWINRLNYHLTKKWDVALEFRTLKEKYLHTPQDSTERGYLFEFTRNITPHLALGAGMNFTKFTDDILEKKEDQAQGFFLRMQGRY